MKTKARAVKVYEGDVEIYLSTAAEWKKKLEGVTNITGKLCVYEGKADFPLLAEVGGSVDVRSGAEAKFPLLAEVGGYVDVSGKAVMPDRNKIGNKPKGVTPIRERFAKHGYLFADDILSRIISKRKQKNIVVYKTTRIGKRRQVQYVVQSGNFFSHGETVKKAIHDLRYKLNDRDTTKYAKWTLDSVHPIADMIQAYRAITGACETGTKQWCEGKTLPAKVSVKVAIRLTREAYAGRKFEAFFKKGAEVKA